MEYFQIFQSFEIFKGKLEMKQFPTHTWHSLIYFRLFKNQDCLHRSCEGRMVGINTLRLRQNGRHFADDVFKCIFLNENMWISLKISLRYVPKGLINNIPALVQIMAWRRPGDKPLSEPMMVSLQTHICVTRPQWVKPQQSLTKSEQHYWLIVPWEMWQ